MNNDLLVTAYTKVFSVKGDLNVQSVTPPVLYIRNRILSMLDCTNYNFDILACARNMSDSQLAEWLFKGVAGDFTVGTGALRASTCKIQTDPTTGYLSIMDATEENRTILTIIVVILFVTVGWILYRPFWSQHKQEGK
jgi:hypothetical protein